MENNIEKDRATLLVIQEVLLRLKNRYNKIKKYKKRNNGNEPDPLKIL